MIDHIFAQDGPIATLINNYVPREAQVKMAKSIAAKLEKKGSIIAEAGTGTGKTFAYLIPAFLSNKKVIISTGTKNLQDQLFYKDIPIVREALRMPLKVALLKGRSNYLCHHRLESNSTSGLFHSKKVVSDMQIVKSWSATTKDGDIAGLTDIPENSEVWSYVTSTADNCLSQDCPFISKCHVANARKEAQQADILVVNHHLYFADMAIKEEGFGELLPGADAVIFDEAHQLPEIASQFFGKRISSRQIIELAKDTIAEYLQSAQDMKEINEAASQLETTAQDMRLAFGLEAKRGPWQEVSNKSELNDAINRVKDELFDLKEILQLAADRSKGLEACWERSEDLLKSFDMLTDVADEGTIHWYETYKYSFVINHTPMTVAKQFKEYLAKTKRAWVFTSATLTVDNVFDHFIDAMGLDEVESEKFESPFDFKKQALFYSPRGLPDNRSDQYLVSVIESALPVINAAKGRTFFLFTSHRALKFAADYLDGKLDYPILVQGDKPKTALLDEFKEKGNAVLLATSSFWEGVDVRGDALSCVIIDKLPFASIGEPVMKARINAIRRQGKEPFIDHQLPLAAIALKQGAGRLIRDIDDSGVLMICDPRLTSRSYGEVFMNTLPTMTRTRDLAKVEKFLRLLA